MYVTRAELKARAKAQLGGQIFANNWMMALLVCLVGSIILSVVNVIPAVGQLACIVVTGPISYGLSAMFLKQARDGHPMQFTELFNGFTEDFLQTFLIGLMTSIFTALWSLLLVIPGIVKAYSYSMAYYVKADNPDYTWNECINESKAMMKGHKADLFIQDLSFIGWMIVGALCIGVGTLWVIPYQQATRAQFYNEIAHSYSTHASER